ncbi:MAG TPA: type II toxin-antitoxin system HicA family toxin [Actinomycetota bacterium]|nr:type II toxin-antitoxin system HicA family toxin [Actinomycetota bacterium]
MVDRRIRHLEKLRTHLKDCSPDLLQSALRAFEFARVRQSGSHATWRHPSGVKITVPIHRPVKRFYVEEAISLCKELMNDPEGGDENDQRE